MVPGVIFEDEHLLAVNKPAGWNTHAPSPHAGEGIYEWLRQREPRWAGLAILHRLDKETSGVLVFGKTPLANRSLTEQFTERQVHKKYLLLTDREISPRAITVKSSLLRRGEKYASGAGGEPAETRFRPVLDFPGKLPKGWRLVEAEPLTGRTHQIRVQASESGFPILGDTLYGGTAWGRVCLHAAELEFAHPATKAAVKLLAPADFAERGHGRLRAAIIDPAETNAFRLVHGAGDGRPGWYVDKLGDYLLSQSELPLTGEQEAELTRLAGEFSSRGAYHKMLSRQVRRTAAGEASPQLVWGEGAPGAFPIVENGVGYELSFQEGYSVGLFLDQRDNRRRLLTGHVAGDWDLPKPKAGGAARPEVLNVFAYTCGFSACAAKWGARSTSLDLSKKYLDWGRRNFVLNGLDPAEHDFIYGDAFGWLRRLAKKRRRFDVIILDPPTFSQSKEHGVFKVERDYPDLLLAALGVLKRGGTLLASANAAEWQPEKFAAGVSQAVRKNDRRITRQHYYPQPPDFPISRAEAAYLKTLWLECE